MKSNKFYFPYLVLFCVMGVFAYFLANLSPLIAIPHQENIAHWLMFGVMFLFLALYIFIKSRVYHGINKWIRYWHIAYALCLIAFWVYIIQIDFICIACNTVGVVAVVPFFVDFNIHSITESKGE